MSHHSGFWTAEEVKYDGAKVEYLKIEIDQCAAIGRVEKPVFGKWALTRNSVLSIICSWTDRQFCHFIRFPRNVFNFLFKKYFKVLK